MISGPGTILRNRGGLDQALAEVWPASVFTVTRLDWSPAHLRAWRRPARTASPRASGPNCRSRRGGPSAAATPRARRRWSARRPRTASAAPPFTASSTGRQPSRVDDRHATGSRRIGRRAKESATGRRTGVRMRGGRAAVVVGAGPGDRTGPCRAVRRRLRGSSLSERGFSVESRDPLTVVVCDDPAGVCKVLRLPPDTAAPCRTAPSWQKQYSRDQAGRPCA